MPTGASLREAEGEAEGELDLTASTGDDNFIFSLTALYRYSSRAKEDMDETATVRFRHTSYTRFGVWKVVTVDNVTGKGTFGYSTLARTTYQNHMEDLYPRRVVARYTGQTVAVDMSGNLYDGDYRLDVDWDDTQHQREQGRSGH